MRCDVGWTQSAVVKSPSDVIRLEANEFSRQQPVKVALTLNEVKVTLDEVKVINSSCVELNWQLIGQREAAEWLRVQSWPVSLSDPQSSRSSALVPVSTDYLLCGLDANTRYGLCVQPIYKSGVVGKCSNTRQTSPLRPQPGNRLDLASY